MGVVMLWRADPTASPAFVYVLAPIAVGTAVLTVRLLASVCRRLTRTSLRQAAHERQ